MVGHAHTHMYMSVALLFTPAASSFHHSQEHMPRVSLHAQDDATRFSRLQLVYVFKTGGRWMINDPPAPSLKRDNLKAGEANSIVEAIRRVVAVIFTLPACLPVCLTACIWGLGRCNGLSNINTCYLAAFIFSVNRRVFVSQTQPRGTKPGWLVALPVFGSHRRGPARSGHTTRLGGNRRGRCREDESSLLQT